MESIELAKNDATRHSVAPRRHAQPRRRVRLRCPVPRAAPAQPDLNHDQQVVSDAEFIRDVLGVVEFLAQAHQLAQDNQWDGHFDAVMSAIVDGRAGKIKIQPRSGFRP